MTTPTTIGPALLVRAAPFSEARTTIMAAAAVREVRQWSLLAVMSLVIAGLLSLAVVIGRLPVLSRLIDDPLFFKRCLVVHVVLALVVWFYAFLAALLALGETSSGGGRWARTAGFALAVVGVGAMLAGALMRGAQPILANYVPVIDHPMFGLGLVAFFTGLLLFVIDAIGAPRRSSGVLPPDARLGLQAAGVLMVMAAATWVSARAGLPEGVDAYTRAEFLAWGPGHVLQAANAAAMLGVWLWLLERASGAPVLSRRAALGAFALLVLPQAAMPLLTVRGTLDALYHTGATHLMRWAIFPVVTVIFVTGLRHLWRHRRATPRFTAAARVARAGFIASAALTVMGMILGACIRSSTTLVPAHYHASLGAVTVAFMAAAYFVCERMRKERGDAGLEAGLWRRAWRQLVVFGSGQSVFALGFALGGAYGLGRKAYAAEQQVRSAGEVAGLLVMGAGGLVAVVGGLWFLVLILREMRAWWRRDAGPQTGISALQLP